MNSSTECTNISIIESGTKAQEITDFTTKKDT